MRDCVAGLDPSLTGFGLAIWPQTSDQPTELQTLKTPPSGPVIGNRMDRIGGLLRRVFDVLDIWQPQVVVLEHYAYQSVNSSDSDGIQRGHYDRVELGGVLRMDLCNTDYIQEVYEVNPSTLKAFVFKGNAKKPEVVNRIFVDWGLLCDTTDEADAAACAKMARCVAGFDQPDSERQETALAKLLGIENWNAWSQHRDEASKVNW